LCILLRTEKADALSAERLAHAFYKSYIGSLRLQVLSWVRKVFFSYTDGLKLAVEIQKTGGYIDTAVLPVLLLNHK
jgi:hypothetical protein